MRICSIDGCNKPHFSRTYCQTHYSRWWRNGDPLMVRKVGMRAGNRLGDSHPLFSGREISYSGAHQRVRRMCGSATKFQCEFCGDRARDWAYTHMDPDELYEVSAAGYRLPYSPDPQYYIPLCKPCHGRFDDQKIGVPA